MVDVRALAPDEWEIARDLRLRALRDAPDEFQETLAEAEASDWRERMARFGDGAHIALIAFEAERTIGIAFAGPDSRDGAVMRIQGVWVEPERRGQHVAATLVEALLRVARDRGKHRARLWVSPSNAPAMACYRRVGFVPNGRRGTMARFPSTEIVEMDRALVDAWVYEPVEVVEPRPEWSERARDERAALLRLVPSFLAIEHVGSTAVPGLPAKPIIDLMAQLADLDEVDTLAPVLVSAHWHFVPPALDERSWRRFFVKLEGDRRAFHLHVMAAGTARWDEQLAFRDALRGDERLRAEYTQLKRTVAERHRDDREAYSRGKSDFVRRVLSRT